MTTDNETRQWAAEWVGWVFDGEHVGELGFSFKIRSDADLAEAVRVKCYEEDPDGPHKHYPTQADTFFNGSDERWAACVTAWGNNGPLAFIRAVREVVES